MKIPSITKNSAINIALDTIQKKKQTLIFVASKRSSEKTAEDLSKKIKGIHLLQLSEQVLKALSRPTKQCERLANCIKKGVAFHHAGLHYKQKELIEEKFRNGTIHTIAATTTLAAGLDLPAFRTIIKDVKRFSGFGMNYIPVLEYLQMAGRAGRPGKEDYGEAIVIASTDAMKEELKERYIDGVPESIYSKLAVEPVLRTYILSLIATDFVRTKKDILLFFSKTFWAHQFRDMKQLEVTIMKMIHLLKDYNFIESNLEGDFVIPNEEEIFKPTSIGKRVAELYIDPYTANHLLTSFKKYKDHEEFSLLQMISYTLEMRPLLRVKLREMDWINEEFLKQDQILIEEPDIYDSSYDDFFDSIKTSLCLQEWLTECDEEYLLNKYAIRPGELHAKLERANWLLYSCTELTRMTKQKNLHKELNKLKARLKYGVKAELLPLLQLKNIGRLRARKLYSNGIKDLKDVKKIDITSLAQIVGKNIAINIKEQVGQKLNPNTLRSKVNKKIGQVSLDKF